MGKGVWGVRGGNLTILEVAWNTVSTQEKAVSNFLSDMKVSNKKL